MNSIGYNVLEFGDGYILDGMAINDSNFWQLEFLALDSSGSVINTNSVQLGGFNTVSGKINSLLKASGNSLIKIGSIRTKTDGKYRPYVLKLDNNLDTISSKIYHELFGVFFQTACLTNRGIACSGFMEDSATGIYRLTLTHIDSNFNLLWHKNFEPGQGLNAWGWTLEQSSDNGFVVGGTKWNSSKSNPWIIKLDSLGLLDWTRTIEETELSEGNASIVLTNDEHILVGSKHPIRISSFNQLLVKGRISKLTLSNEIIWSETYGTPQVGYGFMSMKTYPNGEVLGLAYSQQKKDTLGWHDAWALRVSSEGDSVWESRYDIIAKRPIKDCNTYTWALNVTSDGGFISGGFATYTDTSSGNLVGRQDMWAVKFDSNGCYDTTFSCPTGTQAERSRAKEKLIVYPNPTSGIIHLEGTLVISIEVYDMSGRLVLNKSTPGRAIDCSQLRNGVYILKCEQQSGSPLVLRLVKQ